jgi:hypothetical protein
MADTKSMAGGGSSSGAMPIIGAFVAGIIGVLIFHQIALWILSLIGVAPPVAYNFSTPTKPLGVPVVLSAAFWGGVWAILMSWLMRGREGAGYWWFATLFGAVVVTLGAWFLVPFIKAQLGVTGPATVMVTQRPLAIGIIIGPIVNGAWGFGTALVLKMLPAGWAWR